MGGDRLSGLPDDLLHRVLSFLPSQCVVETSVLSKRWAGLWLSAPCIDISIRSSPINSIDHLHYSGLRETWENMEHFAANLLMLHRALSLDAFRLEIDFIDGSRLRAVDRWIRRAIRYLPSVLEIIIISRHGKSYELPRLMSSGGSCRIKKLRLEGVTLGSSFADQLRSGCPVLEDLELSTCVPKFREIQSSSLKSLAINGIFLHSPDLLVIRAPALASLRLSIMFYMHSKGVSFDGPMPTLVNASVSVSNLPPRDDMIQRNPAELLGSLSGVTNLELSGFSATVLLEGELHEFPVFSNLRNLSLDRCLYGDLDSKLNALGRFLDKAPNLEKLTLKRCWTGLPSGLESRRRKRKMFASDESSSLHAPDQKAFQCQKLKLVEIKYEGCIDRNSDHQLFQFMLALWMNLQKSLSPKTRQFDHATHLGLFLC